MKKLNFAISAAIYFLAFVIGLFGTYSWLELQFSMPLNKSDSQTVLFQIEKGQNLKQVSKNLEKENLIRTWWNVYALHYLSDTTDKIFPGEYEFSANLSPQEIFEKIIKGKLYYRKVTVPEGTRMVDIPKILATTTLATEQELSDIIVNANLSRALGVPSDTFEGYLFPNTYLFTKPTTAREMITEMVNEGRRQIKKGIPNFDARAASVGLTAGQIITLASVIEKETGAAEEREIISSVFHNRLRIGMPLQSDPTVIYGIPDFDGNLTKQHLQDKTNLYNTYENTGLPPTPICNPGLASISAALTPADTDYLYFVSKGDGTHVFAATYAEHVKNVNQYQKAK